MLLADNAQAVSGKLYVLGGGWDRVAPVPTMMAIVAIIGVPWDETNAKHKWTLALQRGDGGPFPVQTPAGSQPLEVTSTFEVGRPPGIQKGQSLSVPIALNVGPITLPLGTYEWVCKINGDGRDDWRLPFYCAEPSGPPQIGFGS